MAVNSLNLLATLRPWRSAGIGHLLASEDAVPLGEDRTEQFIPAPFAEYSPAADAPAPSLSPPPSAPPRVARSAGQASPSSPPKLHSQSGTPQPASKAAIGQRVLPPKDWPEPWRQLIQKVRPAPLLWSYAELAGDLLAPVEDSKARSSLLRALINDLLLPKGTSTFWPLCATPEDAPEAELSGKAPFLCSPFFSAGLALLNPKIIIIFGAEGGDSMPAPAPYTQGIVSGRAFVYLPPLAALSALPAQQHRAAAFLRSMVNQYSLL